MGFIRRDNAITYSTGDSNNPQSHPLRHAPHQCPTHQERYTPQPSPKCPKKGRPACFCVARLPHPKCFPEQHPKVVGCTLERVSLGHVFYSPHPGSSASARFADMCKRSLTSLAAPAVQPPPFLCTHSSSIGSKGCFLLCRLVLLIVRLLSALGNVGLLFFFLTRHNDSFVFIAIVQNDFLYHRLAVLY